MTFLSQFISIRTIESSSSIHRTSIVTKTTKIGNRELALYMKYIQMVEIISLTTDFKTKIPPVKMKTHVSRISCQNFNLI